METSASSCQSSCLLRKSAVVGLLCLYVLLSDCVYASIRLRDMTKQTGITFVHTDGSSGKRYIVETVSDLQALLGSGFTCCHE